MNEWKRFLEQTHPQFQIVTVNEALENEVLMDKASSKGHTLPDFDDDVTEEIPQETIEASQQPEVSVPAQQPESNQPEVQMAQESQEGEAAQAQSGASEDIHTSEEMSEEIAVEAAAPVIETSEEKHGEIEWISPTHNLQNKIENIPDRFGFKIGEAADYVGVKQYVLRYWESEFDFLRPKKSKNGQRVYSKKDIETALLIKKLLHEDRFSIEGAQSALRKLRKQVKDKLHEQAGVAAQSVEIEEESLSDETFLGRPDPLTLQFAEDLLQSIREARTALKL